MADAPPRFHWRSLGDFLRRAVGAFLPRRVIPRDRGECAAARALTALGWDILDANVHMGRDEADLIGRDPDGNPVLVEVKSSAASLIAPERLVGSRKQAALRRLALRLASDRRYSFGGQIPRIDVVVVRLGATPSGDAIERHLVAAVGGRSTQVTSSTGRRR